MRTRNRDRRRVTDAVASLLRRTDEEFEASSTYDELSRLAVEEWSDFLIARPHRRTESFVARLAAEGRRETRERPPRALAIFAVAVSITNDLRDVFLLAEWKARLARQRAEALLALRRYPEALEAVDSAEAFLSHVRDAAAYDGWVANPARAALHSFEKCEDVECANQVRILVADICAARGEIEDANSMYRELLVYFEEQEDEEIVSLLRPKVAKCEADATQRSR